MEEDGCKANWTNGTNRKEQLRGKCVINGTAQFYNQSATMTYEVEAGPLTTDEAERIFRIESDMTTPEVDISVWKSDGSILELRNCISLRYNFYGGWRNVKLLSSGECRIIALALCLQRNPRLLHLQSQ